MPSRRGQEPSDRFLHGLAPTLPVQYCGLWTNDQWQSTTTVPLLVHNAACSSPHVYKATI